MNRLIQLLRKALLQALANDVVNTAKAAAYSGMLMLFPALLVFTTLLAQVTSNTAVVGEVRGTFEQFLPADTMDMLQSYLVSQPTRSTQVIVTALILSVFIGLGLMLSLMEGFRRAYKLSSDHWGFWLRRIRALLLVPFVLLPLALASLLLVFGREIEHWMIANAGHDLRHVVLFFWRMVRWVISISTAVTVLGTLYHFGTPRQERCLHVAPGAIAASLLWFPTTLAFGLYVTRIANYSVFYGSFGAGIATLVWLYISSFSALLGAELNGVLYRERQELKASKNRGSSEFSDL
jgi:membrane protein